MLSCLAVKATVRRATFLVLVLTLAFAVAVPEVVNARDVARISFKMPQGLDQISVKARAWGLAFDALRPETDGLWLRIMNPDGMVYEEAIPPGAFVPNRKGNVLKYKAKKTGTPLIIGLRIREDNKINPSTGLKEPLFKITAEADCWRADPERNPGAGEYTPGAITVLVISGDTGLYSGLCVWERKPWGWKRLGNHFHVLLSPPLCCIDEYGMHCVLG